MEQDKKSQAEIMATSYIRRVYPLYGQPSLLEPIFVAGWDAKPTLQWKKIDPKNLPTGFVLMKNSTGAMIVGIAEEWNGEIFGYLNYPEETDEGRAAWELRGAEYYIEDESLLDLKKEQ